SGPVRPVDTPELVRRGSLFLTRPALADYLADPIERDQLVSELFGHVAEGRILATVNHRYALADAPAAHRALESRSTTGSSIFDLTI
ncbi:MAG: zinc-binding dehydrogenase, partial [Acidimicrobiales bacterium]